MKRKEVCGSCKYWQMTEEISSTYLCTHHNELRHGDDTCNNFTMNYFCASCMKNEDDVDLQKCVQCGRLWCNDCSKGKCVACEGDLQDF